MLKDKSAQVWKKLEPILRPVLVPLLSVFTALVVGAGPLGLLATALIRLAKAYTYVTDIVSEDSPKVHLAEHMEIWGFSRTGFIII